MCNDIKKTIKQNKNGRKIFSVILEYEIGTELGKETQVDECNLNERIGLPWFRSGTWKLRSKKRGAEKGRWRLCKEGNTVISILLKSH